MNELFLDSPAEVEIELSADPVYGEWSEKLEEELQKEFKEIKQDSPAF